jgi:low affinity Fe/Cu permease
MRATSPVRRLAAASSAVVGSPLTFAATLLLTLAWVAAGPFLDWSGTWIVAAATASSAAALLLVLLLQYTQNRDTRAIQLKLDELIRSLGSARTDLVRLEQLSDAELERIEEEFRRLRERPSQRQ